MNRLLIVDDEPIIVDGLYDLLSLHTDLELYSAYSAIEALDQLTTVRMDIVLTDIRMPKMSGIELLEKIKELWPRCKVIFLTGYNDFAYIQTVIRNGGYHYILKTDGDDEIIDAIQRATNEIVKEIETKSRSLQTEHTLKNAKYSLKKDFFNELTQGITHDETKLNKHLKHLEISLSAYDPIYLVLGQVSSSGIYASYSDQLLLRFSIQNITEEIISPLELTFEFISFDRSTFLLIVQPMLLFNPQEDTWKHTKKNLENALKIIQDVCENLYGITISVALSDEPINWDEICIKYSELKFLLIQGFGYGKEILTTDNSLSDQQMVQNHSLHMAIQKIDTLKVFILNGRDSDFITIFRELIDELNQHKYVHPNLKLEVYYTLTCLLLNLINRWDISEIDHLKIDYMKLIQIQKHDTWENAMNFFKNLAEMIIQLKHAEQHERGNDVILKVHEFIEVNLSGDVSLNSIAGSVYLNPQYLSRLYRQVTGGTLSDYITKIRINKAKKLLIDTTMKIHEIATAQGFESSAYFTRFFKRNTNLTPQEFRYARDLKN